MINTVVVILILILIMYILGDKLNKSTTQNYYEEDQGEVDEVKDIEKSNSEILTEEEIRMLSDREILIRTVYGEARSITDEEEIKRIIWVIRNRVKSIRYLNTIKEVCLQPWQFSCWNSLIRNEIKYKNEKEVRKRVLSDLASKVRIDRIIQEVMEKNMSQNTYCIMRMY
jgi:spore germination cell wall hydrolase CwlJ-like protein